MRRTSAIAPISAPMLMTLAMRSRKTNRVQKRRWKVGAEVGGQAATCDETETRADFLDARHQRVRQEHRPQETKAELTPEPAGRAPSLSTVTGR